MVFETNKLTKVTNVTQTPIFTRAFEDISALVWRETERQMPWQFFGKESEEELIEDQRKQIPTGLRNQVRYELETPVFKMRFSSLYQPFYNIALHEFLYFNFGEVQKSLPRMLDAMPFDDNQAELMFEIGKYDGSHKPYVHMKSKNLSSWTNSRYEFTKLGDAMMVDLLAQREKILAVQGMCEADRKLLAQTLGILDDKYQSKGISIVGWYS